MNPYDSKIDKSHKKFQHMQVLEFITRTHSANQIVLGSLPYDWSFERFALKRAPCFDWRFVGFEQDKKVAKKFVYRKPTGSKLFVGDVNCFLECGFDSELFPHHFTAFYLDYCSCLSTQLLSVLSNLHTNIAPGRACVPVVLVFCTKAKKTAKVMEFGDFFTPYNVAQVLQQYRPKGSVLTQLAMVEEALKKNSRFGWSVTTHAQTYANGMQMAIMFALMRRS